MTVMNAEISAVTKTPLAVRWWQVLTSSGQVGQIYLERKTMWIIRLLLCLSHTQTCFLVDVWPHRQLIFNIHVHLSSIWNGLQQLLVLFCWQAKHAETENKRLIEKQHGTVILLRRRLRRGVRMDDSACFSNTRDQKFVFCFWVELSRKCVKDLFFFLLFFLYTRLFHASRTPVNSGHFAAIEPAF